jgi:hypothetical protein
MNEFILHPFWEKTAKLLSIILHPVFVFSYLLIGLVFLTPEFVYFRFNQHLLIAIAYIFINSVVIPVGLLLLVERNIWLPGKTGRTSSLIIMAVAYSFMFYFLYKFHFPGIFLHYVAGCIAGFVLLIFINSAFKISFHTTAVGSAIALLFMLFLAYPPDLFWLLFGSLILAGISGSARLYLKAHTPMEIYTGYGFGFLTILIALLV